MAKWVTFTDSGSRTNAHYRIDLDGMARAEGDYNWANRSRGSVIVQLSGIIAIPIADESEDLFY